MRQSPLHLRQQDLKEADGGQHRQRHHAERPGLARIEDEHEAEPGRQQVTSVADARDDAEQAEGGDQGEEGLHRKVEEEERQRAEDGAAARLNGGDEGPKPVLPEYRHQPGRHQDRGAERGETREGEGAPGAAEGEEKGGAGEGREPAHLRVGEQRQGPDSGERGRPQGRWPFV